MSGLTDVDTVSPAIALTVALTPAPRSGQQPQKTRNKSSPLGARCSRGWEADSGGATPLPAIAWGSLPRGPFVTLSERAMATPNYKMPCESSPNHAPTLSAAGTES